MVQRREPMDKNRIRGRRYRTIRQMTTKSRSVKGANRKSDGCAPKSDESISGGLPAIREAEVSEERSDLTGWQKSADGIAVPAATKACTNGEAIRTALLLSGTPQNVRLAAAFPDQGRGEAPEDAGGGTEPHAAERRDESPARGEQWMIAWSGPD